MYLSHGYSHIEFRDLAKTLHFLIFIYTASQHHLFMQLHNIGSIEGFGPLSARIGVSASLLNPVNLQSETAERQRVLYLCYG